MDNKIERSDISRRQSMALASVSPAEQAISPPVQSNDAEDALDKLLIAIEEKFSNRLGLLHDPVIKKTLQRSSTNPRFDEASAAHLAIKMCDFEMVKALKAAGANFFCLCCDGGLPLHWFAEFGEGFADDTIREQVFQILTEGQDSSFLESVDGETLCQSVCLTRDLEAKAEQWRLSEK